MLVLIPAVVHSNKTFLVVKSSQSLATNSNDWGDFDSPELKKEMGTQVLIESKPHRLVSLNSPLPNRGIRLN